LRAALPSSLVLSPGRWLSSSACDAWGTRKAPRKSSFSVIIFFIPDALARLVGFGAEIAFLLIFPVFMENEFSEWQGAHPSAMPSNGWKAIGWGLVGTAVLVLIFFIMFIGLSALSAAGH
jgi:preprotein translocase subunit SecG